MNTHDIVSYGASPDAMLFVKKPPMVMMASALAGDEFIPFRPETRFAKTTQTTEGEYRSSLGRVSFAIQLTSKELLFQGKPKPQVWIVYSLVLVIGTTKRRFHYRKLKTTKPLTDSPHCTTITSA